MLKPCQQRRDYLWIFCSDVMLLGHIVHNIEQKHLASDVSRIWLECAWDCWWLTSTAVGAFCICRRPGWLVVAVSTRGWCPTERAGRRRLICENRDREGFAVALAASQLTPISSSPDLVAVEKLPLPHTQRS